MSTPKPQHHNKTNLSPPPPHTNQNQNPKKQGFNQVPNSKPPPQHQKNQSLSVSVSKPSSKTISPEPSSL